MTIGKSKIPGSSLYFFPVILIYITAVCVFPVSSIADNGLEWQPIDVINTEYHEFSPTISPDGKFMVFDSSRPGGLGDKDLWISYYSNEKWTKPENLIILNSPSHDHEPFLAYDGNALLFSSDRIGGYGVGDIYVSYKNGNTWSRPINLGPVVNTKDSEKMPSASIDNKEIYFARIPVDYALKKLNKKYIQIYVSKYENNQWYPPVKLPSPVNELAFDCAPRIMPDNKSLMFCSLREGGKGSYDIWMVKRQNRNKPWSGITNLSSVNTTGNETYFAFTISGDRMYMASRWGEAENYDIYEYIVKEQIIDPTITLQGRITNKKDGKPVPANITIELFSNPKEKFEVKSDKITGTYSVTLPGGDDYSLTVEAPGFMFYSERINLTKLSNSSVTNRNIGLHPLEKGENIIIKTIYFDPDSHKLRNESKIALDRVTRILKQNPEMRLLIKGHVSEDVGGKMDSQWLSEKRAMAVKDYIVEHGIESSRLETKGYGGTQPIGDNTTVEGQKLNRRTEFEILSE